MIDIVVYIGAAFVILYYFLSRKRKNFPPGPRPLPFLGNVLELGNDPHIGFSKLSKEYGPIVGVELGQTPGICLHGTKLIKEALNEVAFAGRPQRESTQFILGEPGGIANSVGDVWNEQRRFALRNLRDFGFGKSSMEEMIMEEVKDVNDWLRQQNGAPVALQRRFALAVVNSLWKILTGQKIHHNDKILIDILDGLESTAEILFGKKTIKSFILVRYQTIAKYFFNWSKWSYLSDLKTARDNQFFSIIEEHKETLSENNPRDFIDVYLQEIMKTTNSTSSFHSNQGTKSLKCVMSDFFLAGTDTTSVTLSWAMLYLLHYPAVQKKLHAELDREVGSGRNPSLSDRKMLPYTDAVVLETLRISSIAPLSLPHASIEDTKFHGFDIPKGTIVLANLYAAHHDPDVWGDPEVFRPERFLNADETILQKHEGLLLPFSVGRRVCVGETLARDTLFLFVANLLHNFEVTVPPGCEKPPLQSKRQLTITPVSSTLVMKERFTN